MVGMILLVMILVMIVILQVGIIPNIGDDISEVHPSVVYLVFTRETIPLQTSDIGKKTVSVLAH